MVYAYDQAIIEEFRKIFNDGRIHIIPPEDAFDLVATLQSDKIEFPLITLTRPGWALLDNKPQHMIFEGLPDNITESQSQEPDRYDSTFEVVRLQALPMRINYQIDVWTTTREENDNLMREIIWYITLYPTLKVKITYENEDRYHNFNMFLDADIEDNSDITGHKEKGRLFRQTISMYVDDAYLWKSFKRLPNYVDPDQIKVVQDNSLRGDEI